MANLYSTNPFFLELQYHGNQKILDFQTLCIPGKHTGAVKVPPELRFNG